MGDGSGAGGAIEEAAEVEDDEEGDQRSGGIEKGIPGRSVAESFEGLMDFVKGRIASGNEPGRKSPGPVPAAASATNTTVEKNKKDEVFDEVGGFAKERVNDFELALGNGRNEPAEDGPEERGGMVGGKRVGGGGKDDRGPEKRRPPSTEPGRNEGKKRSARTDLVESGSRARVAPGFGGGHCAAILQFHCK